MTLNRYFLFTMILCISGCTLDNQTEQHRHIQNTTDAQANIHRRTEMIQVDRDISQWSTVGGDFSETHYSELTQVDENNVNQLGLAWEYDTKTTRGLEATPIMVNGVIYTSGTWGKVFAVDAATGEEIWFFDPQVDGQVARDACCGVVNRGVAVWKSRVYVASLDGRLFALDAQNGNVVWEVDTIDDPSRRYTSTGAPRIAGDVVIIGNAGAEFDARGYVSAYDLDSGDFKWRFFTVPGSPKKPYEHAELAMAAETWDPNSRWDVGGGGTVWDSMVYDPKLNLIYVGTGNSAVYVARDRSPAGGDNLFLSSILAINPENGELVWYYQTTPADSWDFTATQNMILADLQIEGANREVLMQAPKNGYFYVLDRRTGELLSAEHYVPVNWSSHVDMKTGKPVLTEAANYFDEPKVSWPATAGGHGWRPMAFSKEAGLVYIPAFEDARLRVNLFPDGYEYIPGRLNTGALGIPPFAAAVDAFESILPYDTDYLKSIIAEAEVPPARAVLKAWDPIQQKLVWEADAGGLRNDGGVLATAGNLVIYGKASGQLVFRNAQTGDLLHSIDIGTGIMAAPMTYAIDGQQYIAVMAGLGSPGFFSYPRYSAAYERSNQGRLLAFKLGGGPVELAEHTLLPSVPKPPPRKSNRDQVGYGKELFLWHCRACHANAGRGAIPDLRYLGEGKHLLFDQIVREGLFTPMGMPRFDDLLSKEDTDAIQAYLIDKSWQAYEAQNGAFEEQRLPDMADH